MTAQTLAPRGAVPPPAAQRQQQRQRPAAQQRRGSLGACRLRAAGAAGASRRAPARGARAAAAAGSSTGSISPELRSAIDQFIAENKVVAFIKGTKQMPLCGFSNTVCQILNAAAVPYVTVNVLEDELLRAGMKEYSQWPTFPQVYVDGEFFGGADIMIAAYQSGELAEVLERAAAS